MTLSTSKATNKKSEIDLRQVRKWLKDAGKFALSQRDSLQSDIKLDGSVVTDVDRHVESMLFEHISQTYPNHQILSEEGSNQRNDGEFLWAIDPIDGTRAYATGLPVWGISVGVLKQGKPYAGFFYMPATGEMYWGIGKKGFYDDQPMLLHNDTNLQNTLAFIAVPSNAHRHYEISFNRLRSLGSTTAHLAYVARNVAVAALTRQIYLWDIASVLPILDATGVGLMYLSGKPLELSALLDGSLSPEPLVAAPIDILDDVRALIHRKTGVFP